MECLSGEQLSTTLELLQSEARTFSHNIAKHHSSQANTRINELKRRVVELERKKYDLLQQSSITTVGHKIVAGGTCDIPHSSTLRTSQQVLQNAEERKLEAFLQTYRLAGTSIIKYENGILLIELLTSFEGRYYEAYYVELSDKGDNKVLSHHTVPYFIPITSYYESYLAGKIHVLRNIQAPQIESVDSRSRS